MAKPLIGPRLPLRLWLVMGLFVSLILFAGFYTATPWLDDWIFIGRSESLADAFRTTLDRLIQWSPRPGSEPTIFGSLYLARKLGLAGHDLTIPLLFISYLQALALALWPSMLKRFRALGYLTLSVSLTCVLMAAALIQYRHTQEVLFWGAGSAAYLPTLAAWFSGICCLYLWGVTRERLFFWVAVLQCFFGGLFWEVGITASLFLPGVPLLLLSGLDGQLRTASGRRNLIPLLAPLLVSSLTLSTLLIPGLIKRFAHETGGQSLSRWDALLWSLQWPIAQAGSLLQQHAFFLVPLVAVLAGLLVSQVKVDAYWPAAMPRQRRALLVCGVSCLWESVVLRYFLITSFGRLEVYGQRHEVAALFLLIFGISLLLAAAVPAGLSAWLRDRKAWLSLSLLSMLSVVLIASPSVHDIVAEAVQKARGLQELPIVMGSDSRQGTYALSCSPHAYAKDLPLGEWTRSGLIDGIQSGSKGYRPYEFKILKGILSGHHLERLTVVGTSAQACP